MIEGTTTAFSLAASATSNRVIYINVCCINALVKSCMSESVKGGGVLSTVGLITLSLFSAKGLGPGRHSLKYQLSEQTCE